MVDYTLYSSVQTVHQKLRFFREDGDWRVHDIIRFYTDSDGKEVQYSLMKSMQDYLSAPQEEASELNYANMDGVYDSLDENMNSVSRISLNADGTATWCMVGNEQGAVYSYWRGALRLSRISKSVTSYDNSCTIATPQ